MVWPKGFDPARFEKGSRRLGDLPGTVRLAVRQARGWHNAQAQATLHEMFQGEMEALDCLPPGPLDWLTRFSTGLLTIDGLKMSFANAHWAAFGLCLALRLRVAGANMPDDQRYRVCLGLCDDDPIALSVPSTKWFEIGNGHTVSALRDFPDFPEGQIAAGIRYERGKVLAAWADRRAPNGGEHERVRLADLGKALGKTPTALRMALWRAKVVLDPVEPAAGTRPAWFHYGRARAALVALNPAWAANLPESYQRFSAAIFDK